MRPNAERTRREGESRRERLAREAGGKLMGRNDPEGRRGIPARTKRSQDALRGFWSTIVVFTGIPVLFRNTGRGIPPRRHSIQPPMAPLHPGTRQANRFLPGFRDDRQPSSSRSGSVTSCRACSPLTRLTACDPFCCDRAECQRNLVLSWNRDERTRLPQHVPSPEQAHGVSTWS